MSVDLTETLDDLLPAALRDRPITDKLIPALAKDATLTQEIEAALRRVPTSHRLYRGDARAMPFLEPASVHLVVTSPPYWTLKRYRDHDDQMGHIEDYEQFLDHLDRVWQRCYDALVPGGRLVCVVGDVCLSRRKNQGRHTVVPLHAAIQERCRRIGFDNLAPIIWHKIANAVYEVPGNGGFLGKPYEPNAVIKNDIEFILLERQSGGYRSPVRRRRSARSASSRKIDTVNGSSRYGPASRVRPRGITPRHIHSNWRRVSSACSALSVTPCSTRSSVREQRRLRPPAGEGTASALKLILGISRAHASESRPRHETCSVKFRSRLFRLGTENERGES